MPKLRDDIPKRIEYEGWIGTIYEHCKKHNLNYSTVHCRVQKGMDPVEALWMGTKAPFRNTRAKQYGAW